MLAHALGIHHLRRLVAPTGARRRVVCVSGEPHFAAGHLYRVERLARSLTELGYLVEVVAAKDVRAASRKAWSRRPAIVFIWRAVWSEALGKAINRWRAAGARIVYDVDDYMFDPDLATTEVIDGIRSQRLAAEDVVRHYRDIRRTMSCADVCLVPTQPLADGVHLCKQPALVSVNGFDDDTYRRSREAAVRRRSSPPDGLVRIGYASGSRTHQRDFAVAASAVARVLRERPECRLVLFRAPGSGLAMLDLEEFPEFRGLEQRIEWRDTMPLTDLPRELARFDINIAPLETGNVYCEAKSELKYFEAALVGVPTIASPTQPFRQAIVDGTTGYLAADATAWHRHLDALARDAGLRSRVGQASLHHVLHRYGPDGRRQRLAGIMSRLLGDPAEATSAFRLEHLAGEAVVRLPQVPEAEVVLAQGGDRIAQVAVVVPLYNYASYVVEALDSVANQTLASLELIVVDDRSTDASLQVARDWLERHANRFVSAVLLRNTRNQGLPLTRNVGFARAEAPFVFPLDADNTLGPDCLRLLADRLGSSRCSATHPTVQRFGDCTIRQVAQPWSPDRLKFGNYIDAMALLRKSAWAHAGGYTKGGFVGWEDFELWCKFVEAGLWSDPVPEAEAGYRVHGGSMLHTHTNRSKQSVVDAIHAAHPWLTVEAD